VKAGSGRRDCRTRIVVTLVAWGLFLALAGPVAAYPLTIVPRILASEGYSSNIFFTEPASDDFFTRVFLGLHLLYETERSSTTFSIGTSGVYLAKQSTGNLNLAEAQQGILSSTYRWSQNLTFTVNDRLGRVGDVRDLGFVTSPGAFNVASTTPQQQDPAGSNPGGVSLILPRGSALANSFGISGSYQLDPRWTTSLSYANGVSDFTDPSVTNLSQTWGGTLGYLWDPEITLNGNFAYARLNATNAQDTETYILTGGVSYQLADVWTAYASIGGSLNRPLEPGDGGTRGAFTFSVNISRTFQYSELSAGAQQGFTPSAGIAGASKTLLGYIRAQTQLTEYLGSFLYMAYTNFNTSGPNFNVFQLQAGVSYPVWRNISAGLIYGYLRRESVNTVPEVLAPGVIDSNTVLLQLTWAEPLWEFDL
jgi:hypothetical protein